MKKTLILFCITTTGCILVCSNLFAAICVGDKINCPSKSTDPDAPPCCASSAAACELECGTSIPLPTRCPLGCTESTWTNVPGKNYQRMCDKLSSECLYQCVANYYQNGLSLSGQPPTCTPCPNPGGTAAFSSAKDITACYVAPGVRLVDSSGTYSYSQNCHYSK